MSSGAGVRLCSMVSVAPMKSKTVAPNRRTSSQKPEAENRSPMAAVVPSTSRRQHGEHGGVEVEERERAVEDVVVAQLEVLDHQLRLAHGVAVGQHAALRRPGRAGGEQHHGRVGDRVGGRVAVAPSVRGRAVIGVDVDPGQVARSADGIAGRPRPGAGR